MGDFDNPALVIGGGVTSLGIIRNLGSQGIDVYSAVDRIDIAGNIISIIQEIIIIATTKDTNSFISVVGYIFIRNHLFNNFKSLPSH